MQLGFFFHCEKRAKKSRKYYALKKSFQNISLILVVQWGGGGGKPPKKKRKKKKKY